MMGGGLNAVSRGMSGDTEVCALTYLKPIVVYSGESIVGKNELSCAYIHRHHDPRYVRRCRTRTITC